MHLYLLRHAEDRPTPRPPHTRRLTDRGHRQAWAAARWLAGQHPTEIRSSTLARARRTADAVGREAGLPVREDPHLNEIHWESPTGESLPHPRENRWYPPPPGAESWHDFMGRVALSVSGLCRNASRGQRIVLVTHSGFFDAVQELLNGGGSRVELKVAHTGITQWEYRPGCFGGSWLLHRHNIVPGLSPLPSPTPDGPGNPGGTEPNT